MTPAEAERLLATLRGGWGRTSLAETGGHIPMGDIAALLWPLKERGHWQERRLPGRPGVLERTWVPESAAAPLRFRPAPKSSSSSRVRLRDHGPAFTVSIPFSVRTAMEEEIRTVLARFEGAFHETGGWLFALERSRFDSCRVVFASGPGERAEHSPARIRLTAAEEVQGAFPDFLERANLQLVGEWHTHSSSATGPSQPDLDCWARMSAKTGKGRWVSLIVAPAELGWACPAIRGWVTLPDGLEGRFVCGPARVSE